MRTVGIILLIIAVPSITARGDELDLVQLQAFVPSDTPGTRTSEDKPDVAQQMKAFRKQLPPPQTFGEQIGITFTDNNGDYFGLTHLSGVAQRMHVDGEQDLIGLVFYLRDKELKIRTIAAMALEHRLEAIPGGLSMRDIEDMDSDGHAKMVSVFVKKIKERFATADANKPPD